MCKHTIYHIIFIDCVILSFVFLFSPSLSLPTIIFFLRLVENVECRNNFLKTRTPTLFNKHLETGTHDASPQTAFEQSKLVKKRMSMCLKPGFVGLIGLLFGSSGGLSVSVSGNDWKSIYMRREIAKFLRIDLLARLGNKLITSIVCLCVWKVKWRRAQGCIMIYYPHTSTFALNYFIVEFSETLLRFN